MAKQKTETAGEFPQIVNLPIGLVYENSENPRFIRDDKFKKLVQSIKDFPQMLNLRPVVINAENVILGGNMRYKAAIEAGLKTIPTIQAGDLNEEQQREFIIKDNVGFGEWDFEMLANGWDAEKLTDWGLDVPLEFGEPAGGGSGGDDQYTKKVEAPVYEPGNEKPAVSALVDDTKAKELIREITQTDLPEDEKMFLLAAAYRHLVFDYAKIADYYANSDKQVQELMEKSALVIIDFNQAIENGYVELTKGIAELYAEDYEDED